MKRVTWFGVLLILFIILAGCGKEVEKDEKTAEEYVKKLGYKITTSRGEVHKYVLDKTKLTAGTETTPYLRTWGVQKVGPEKYFGKEISIYSYTVKNHPLEKIYKDKTKVYIMLSEGIVIGGYSFPEGMVGAPFSLDGRTLEEVTGLTYREWSANWQNSYGE
ncbi:MAG: hypothetical protein ACYC2T_08185 [Bacillota bacterium]